MPAARQPATNRIAPSPSTRARAAGTRHVAGPDRDGPLAELAWLPACRDALVAAERAADLFRVEPAAAMRLLKEKYDYRLAMDFPERVRRLGRQYQEGYEYQMAVGCKSWDRVAMWAVHPNPYCAFIMAADLVAVLLSRGNRESVRAQKAIVCDMVRDV